MSEAKQKILDAMAKHGLTVTSEFVPWSKSRNAKEKGPSLNWRVTLKRGDRETLTTDYGAGLGHCPVYKKIGPNQAGTINGVEWVKRECETGYEVFPVTGNPRRDRPILPDPADVVYALTRDAEVLNSSTFESWARDYGYDTDSRKAEAIYKACLEIALALRNGIGEQALADLNKACEDY